MNPNAGARRHFPALRPLACCVMLALTSLAAPALMAETLDGEHETLDENSEVDSWILVNGARLTVNGGTTENIHATDSFVELDGATVGRNAMAFHAIDLYGTASLDAQGSTFKDGAVLLSDDAQAYIHGSTITVDGSAVDFNDRSAVGVYVKGLDADDTASIVLGSTTISVAEKAGQTGDHSGIGVLQESGEVQLVNGTQVDAANVGVRMRGVLASNNALKLLVDNSHIASGRGAAIEVVTDADISNRYDIKVTGSSTLRGADGNLLRVGGATDTAASGTTAVDFSVEDAELTGDIVFDPTTVNGNLDVTLLGSASILGRFHNVTAASLFTGSSWQLTGDSTVGRLQVNGGSTVVLGDGVNFNTLSLDAFDGRQGTLVFNTVLEGDASQTDKLVISGDATGEAGVVVRNAGGQGAQTTQGIELITIGGLSDALFTLQGRATGGLYEYFLIKDANGNWYLRSELEDEPDPEQPHPCEIDQSLPECQITLPVEPEIGLPDPVDPDPVDPDPVDPDPITPDPEEPGTGTPVLRPETGAYLANLAAMDTLLRSTAADRINLADSTDGVRTWTRTDHAEGRMDVTGRQHLRTAQSRLQVGADVGAFDGGRGRIGAMLGVGQADATSRSTVTGYRAQGKVEGGSAGLYAHWSTPTTYLDASVQHGRFSHRVEGEGLAAERYDAASWQASLEAGHRFSAGRVGGMSLHLQPQAQLTYTRTTMDRHVESNGTVIEDAGGNGLAARVGVRLEGDATVAVGQLRPYLALDGHHSTVRNALRFDGEQIEGGLPATRVELSAGGQLQFGNRLSGFVGLSASHGDAGYRDFGARAGLSWRW